VGSPALEGELLGRGALRGHKGRLGPNFMIFAGHRLRRADLAQNAHHGPDPNAELARNSTVEVLAAARTSRFDRSDNPAVAGGEIAMAPTCRAPDA
jgi:hypothetical protein